MWFSDGGYLNMRVDVATIEKLQLSVGMNDIVRAIRKSKGLKLEGAEIRTSGSHLRIYIPETSSDNSKKRALLAVDPITGKKPKKEDEYFVRVQNLKRALPDVVVSGYPDTTRAIISKGSKPNADGKYEHTLLVEGYGLKLCMTTEGVDGTKTKTNSVMEVREVLGIEAARTTIIAEIGSVMGNMDIDPRHMQLLADVMTYKGEILGITRFGLAKMRDSVLQLASFEKTPDHLFEAGAKQKADKIEGVSESIIMGQPAKIGTGAVQMTWPVGIALEEEGLTGPETTLQSVYDEINKEIGVKTLCTRA